MFCIDFTLTLPLSPKSHKILAQKAFFSTESLGVNVSVYGCLLCVCQPCNELGTCPACTLSQCLLKNAAAPGILHKISSDCKQGKLWLYYLCLIHRFYTAISCQESHLKNLWPDNNVKSMGQAGIHGWGQWEKHYWTYSVSSTSRNLTFFSHWSE